VETLGFNHTSETVEHLPEKTEPEEGILPRPRESNLPAGQEPGDLPGEDLNSIHSPTQTTLERNETEEVMDQTETEIERGCFRRSTRDRKAPNRLTYPELGNPLVTVVQSLFQSLSEVITHSLAEPSFPEPLRVMTV